jgi:release factor glutamine methyltransferase
MTMLEVLNWATDCLRDHGIQNPRLNAELLLTCSLNVSREGLYVHLHDPIGEEEKKTMEEMIDRGFQENRFNTSLDIRNFGRSILESIPGFSSPEQTQNF